jgi:membrane-associated phospholipid phosphatase
MRKLFKHYTFVDYATQGYAVLVGLLILFFHNGTVPHWPLLLGIHVFILLLIHALIRTQARRKTGGVLDFFRHFYPVLLYIYFFSETGWLNRMFFGDYLDPNFVRAEQRIFGCQPSILFMEKLPWLPVSELFYASYFSYYLMIGGVGIALFIRNREQFFHYISVVSFVFYVCYLIYITFPVIGPPLFYGQHESFKLPDELLQTITVAPYPDVVTTGPFYKFMGFIYRFFEAPGAAFPSSHVAIALCTLSFSFRYLRPIRYVHLVFAILLCLSTVYCRYHYAVDVVAGVLTAAVLVPLGNKLYSSLDAANCGREAVRHRLP